MLTSVLVIVGGVVAVGTTAAISVGLVSGVANRIKNRKSKKTAPVTITEPKTKSMSKKQAIEIIEKKIAELDKDNQKVNSHISKIKHKDKECESLMKEGLTNKWNSISNQQRKNLEKRVETIKKAPPSSDFEKMSSMSTISADDFIKGGLADKEITSIEDKYPAYKAFCGIESSIDKNNLEVSSEFESFKNELKTSLLNSQITPEKFNLEVKSKTSILKNDLKSDEKISTLDKDVKELQKAKKMLESELLPKLTLLENELAVTRGKTLASLKKCNELLVNVDRQFYSLKEKFGSQLDAIGEQTRKQIEEAEKRIAAAYEEKMNEVQKQFNKALATKVVSKKEFEQYVTTMGETLKSEVKLNVSTLENMLKSIEIIEKVLAKQEKVNSETKQEIKNMKNKLEKKLTKTEIVKLVDEQIEAKNKNNEERIGKIEEQMKDLADKLSAKEIIELYDERLKELEKAWKGDKTYVDSQIAAAKVELKEFLRRSLSQRLGVRLDEKLQKYFETHQDKFVNIIEKVIKETKINIDVEDEELLDKLASEISNRVTISPRKKQ